MATISASGGYWDAWIDYSAGVADEVAYLPTAAWVTAFAAASVTTPGLWQHTGLFIGGAWTKLSGVEAGLQSIDLVLAEDNNFEYAAFAGHYGDASDIFFSPVTSKPSGYVDGGWTISVAGIFAPAGAAILPVPYDPDGATFRLTNFRELDTDYSIAIKRAGVLVDWHVNRSPIYLGAGDTVEIVPQTPVLQSTPVCDVQVVSAGIWVFDHTLNLNRGQRTASITQ